ELGGEAGGRRARPAVEVAAETLKSNDQPGEQADRGEDWIAGQQIQESRGSDGRDDSDEGFDAEEKLDARGLHGGALQADLKRTRRVCGIEARDDRGESLHDRLQGALGDGALQLELFEGPRTNRDLLQSSLHRVELLADEERREDEEDPECDDAGEDQDLHA